MILDEYSGILYSSIPQAETELVIPEAYIKLSINTRKPIKVRGIKYKFIKYMEVINHEQTNYGISNERTRNNYKLV